MQEEEATHLLTSEDLEEAISVASGATSVPENASGGPEELDEQMRTYLQSLAFEEDGGDGTGNWPQAGAPNQLNMQTNDWDFNSPQVQRLTALKTWR